jgi:S-formylglutathione hydrolase FrmB
MMTVKRRALLLGGLGAGLGVVGIGAGVVTDVLPGGPTLRRALGMTGPDGAVPDAPAGPVHTERERSAARDTDVDVITMTPEGVDPKGLPVCLVLHGRGGTARSWLDLGLPRFLTAAHRSGVPPFAVLAVDGGKDSYWVASRSGDDPQRMLTEEVPGWLAKRGLRKSPCGVLGISMGGFGALNYVRRQRGTPVAALLSPALFRTWAEASSRGVFPDSGLWEAKEPLRHISEIKGVPLGVWCGTEDSFITSTRSLIDAAHPAMAAISSGAHEAAYWLRVLPDALRFVGAHLGAASDKTPAGG